MLLMVKVKYTTMKSQMASQQMHVAHPCHFPGCTRVFSHWKGMSQHMAKVHGIAAGSYKAVTTVVALDMISAPSCATPPSTSFSRPESGEV